MTPDTVERIVWTGMAAAMAFALSEQRRKGLIRAHPWFAAWLAISLASFAGLVWLPMDGRPYRIACATSGYRRRFRWRQTLNGDQGPQAS